jgi:hypothetical protein
MTTKAIWYGVILLVLLDALLFIVFISSAGQQALRYPEIGELTGTQLSFSELSRYFTKLAQKKGAPYAFEVLQIAPVPPGTDLHLLGHSVGDVLYKQQGVRGIQICTQDFRNACSHSIVVGLFVEKGEAALPQIVDACRQAPGKSGAYTMCFHGLGHGILAALNYDMSRAVEVFKKIGKAESSQCISGTIMEIIGGGFHNRELWKKENAKYLGDNNPLSLCQRDFMPEEARPLCYTYLTPHLFAAAGGNLQAPTPSDFKKAFTFCDALPRNNTPNRNACFDGFGKEFVVLAKNRDVRNIEAMTDEELARVYEWCLLTPDKTGALACVNSAMQSLYWGGENDRNVAVKFCGILKDDFYRAPCFKNLIGAVSFYINDPVYKKEFCAELPDHLLSYCRERLAL